MPQGGCGLRQQGQRQQGLLPSATDGHHGQHHPATGGHGVGQQQVVLGVVQILFGQQKIQTNRLRLPGADVAQHLGMQRPPPGPAANAGDAAIVGQHQHHLGGGGAGLAAGDAVLQPGIALLQLTRLAQAAHQGQQGHGQQQPLQPQRLVGGVFHYKKRSCLRF